MNYTPSIQLFINGHWKDSEKSEKLPVYNPATGDVIGYVAHARSVDLEEAVEASLRGFEIWRKTPAFERAKLMYRAAKILYDRVDMISSLLTQEQGKPLSESKTELLGAIGFIEWAAGEATRVYGRTIEPRSVGTELRVLRKPIGPVAAFTPWNFPVNQVIRKLSAALATGNSIIIKGPEETPASPAELVRAFQDAGIPPGVIGLVYGNPSEISEFLVTHPIIRKITFTGSTEVGKKLAAMAGRHMKRITMELGGHAPVIVASDADVNKAVKALTFSKFRNAGQVCISPTRFLIHESIAKEFTEGMLVAVKGINIGNGLDSSVTMGPLAHKRRVDAMDELIESSCQNGARLLCGGTLTGAQ